ncbi:hypothetical protein NDU88_006371 [Pleurodeles waltl]|uniref:Uncharacterized protein n=1 Tax=Pleurodeles waltl TaxID=8319 RepID=A0AAV7VPI0_PLEWA|nr:hypothetical protein NDU88_006371 [Pleurodeles waltl]
MDERRIRFTLRSRLERMGPESKAQSPLPATATYLATKPPAVTLSHLSDVTPKCTEGLWACRYRRGSSPALPQIGCFKSLAPAWEKGAWGSSMVPSRCPSDPLMQRAARVSASVPHSCHSLVLACHRQCRFIRTAHLEATRISPTLQAGYIS